MAVKEREAMPKLPKSSSLSSLRRSARELGVPKADIDAAVDAIAQLCRLIETSPVIDEIEVNPLMLAQAGSGVLALDAVIWNTAPIPQEEDVS